MNLRWTLWGIISVLAVVPVIATDINWFTIDGGGEMLTTGGGFELSGTIGQPDAGIMTGGSFELSGGFWAGAVPQCACLGDMNSDGNRDGADISTFLACIIQGGSCLCADVNGMNGVTVDDVAVFVNDLLGGAGCP